MSEPDIFIKEIGLKGEKTLYETKISYTKSSGEGVKNSVTYRQDSPLNEYFPAVFRDVGDLTQRLFLGIEINEERGKGWEEPCATLLKFYYGKEKERPNPNRPLAVSIEGFYHPQDLLPFSLKITTPFLCFHYEPDKKIVGNAYLGDILQQKINYVLITSRDFLTNNDEI